MVDIIVVACSNETVNIGRLRRGRYILECGTVCTYRPAITLLCLSSLETSCQALKEKVGPRRLSDSSGFGTHSHHNDINCTDNGTRNDGIKSDKITLYVRNI